jgi:hypothetical protein
LKDFNLSLKYLKKTTKLVLYLCRCITEKVLITEYHHSRFFTQFIFRKINGRREEGRVREIRVREIRDR